MAVVSDITTVANATGSGHGFTLTQYTNAAGKKIAVFTKDKKGESGTTGQYQAVWGVGEDASNATTARTNALAALNANRRHRYAGAPGSPSGATVTTWPDGAATVPTVDSN
jgi:hypothetical protein